MISSTPYLADETIECDASELLTEFERARGIVIAPPIPIEDIVEKHLKLCIEFDDTDSMFALAGRGNDPGILGAIFFDDRRIVIDERLDPTTIPANEACYRFTLAHEGGGHWRLHRHHFTRNWTQHALFGQQIFPTFVCRSSKAKMNLEERQANFYASCLLMPRNLVFQAWRDRFGNDDPKMVRRHERTVALCDAAADAIASAETLKSVIRLFNEIREIHDHNALLEEFAQPFAEQFMVSPDAMRGRLETLGLIKRETIWSRVPELLIQQGCA